MPACADRAPWRDRARTKRISVSSWPTTSETRRSAGADDLTRLAADVPEPVRQVAREVIRFTCRKHARDTRKRELDASFHDDPALFATMREHFITCLSAGGISLVEQRQLAPRALRGHEPQRDLLI